jgi:molybdopterin converting factor subunit 1
MRVRVRLFAALRERVGRSELALDLAVGATPETAWRRLLQDYPALDRHRTGLAVAVNRRYSSFDAALQDDDEVAFIPPVAGG